MKAMILAAGYGTRLKPLTFKRPKALMPVANIPMVDRTIAYLKQHGVTEIIVNAHHMHHQIISHFADAIPHGIPIHVAVEEHILGTGGGIKNVEGFWDSEPFVVINVDIITDINLTAAIHTHRKNHNLVTLVLHDYPQFNQVKVDPQGKIRDFYDTAGPGLLAFTGIHVLSKPALDYIPPARYYNIIEAYRSIINDSNAVGSYVSKDHYWTDMGSIDSYIQANKEMVGKEGVLVDGDSVIQPGATIEGWGVIGANTIIGESATIRDSIVWDGVKIGKSASIVNSIITQEVAAGSTIRDRTY